MKEIGAAPGPKNASKTIFAVMTHSNLPVNYDKQTIAARRWGGHIATVHLSIEW